MNKTSLLENSAVISFFNALGFISALVVDIVVVARFGLGAGTDAFFIALVIPQLIVSIMLASSNVAFVPVFSTVKEKHGEGAFWDLINNLTNLLIVVFFLLSILGIIISPYLVQIVGAGLDEVTKSLASEFSVLLFLMVIPVGAVEVAKSTFYTLGVFSFPSATSLIKNLSIISLVFLLPSELHLFSLVWGYVISTWVQSIVLFSVLKIRGHNYRLLYLNLKDEHTKTALQQIKYPLSGTVLGQSNILFERFLASFLPAGVVSALAYARRILSAIDRIFITSISTSLLPNLADQSISVDKENFNKTIKTGLNLSLVIAIPIMIWFTSLDVPIIRLLFQRGKIGSSDTLMMAKYLRLYIISIPAVAYTRSMITSYYARGNTKTPFNILIASLILNILIVSLSFFLLNDIGLPLGLSISRFCIGIIVSIVFFREFPIWNDDLRKFLVKISIGGLISYSSINLFIFFSSSIDVNITHIKDLFDIIFGMVLSLLVYYLVLKILRMDEVNRLQEVISRVIKTG